MEYEHVTVVLEDDTIAGIEVRLGPDQTVEDWVEDAVARRFGDGETVGDPLERQPVETWTPFEDR